MKLIVTEKNDAAGQIARLLSESGKPKADKVYDTPVYRFRMGGEDCVTIGLRGHILQPDFPTELKFNDSEGWFAVDAEGEIMPADLPDGLERPPYKSKRKPYLKDGIDIKGWKIASLPYLVWAPIQKLPAEKGIIRSLKNLAKKADSVVIGTDFDREGELIGSDALRQILDVNPDVPVSRARYSAFTKAEIDHAFANLVDLDQDLAASTSISSGAPSLRATSPRRVSPALETPALPVACRRRRSPWWSSASASAWPLCPTTTG